MWSFSRESAYFELMNERYDDFLTCPIDATPLVAINGEEEASLEKERVEFMKVAEEVDIVLVEVKKPEGFTFEPENDGEEMAEHPDMEMIPKSFELKDIFKSDLRTILQKNSKQGKTGLQNIGNTCYMNSGL